MSLFIPLGHVSITIEAAEALEADLRAWPGLVLDGGEDPALGEPVLSVRVQAETTPGGPVGPPEYQCHGRVGDRRWGASSPAWWDAEGHGLDRVRLRLRSGGPGGPCLGIRSFLRFLASEVFARTGGVALHAAAVARPEGAVVLLARSGGGKTTAARAFGQGAVLADDFCLLSPARDRFRVLRSPFPGREATPPAGRPAWLWRIVEIEKAGRVSLVPLPRDEAVASVLKAAFLFGPDRDGRAAILEVALRLVTGYGVGRLRLNLTDEPWGVL